MVKIKGKIKKKWLHKIFTNIVYQIFKFGYFVRNSITFSEFFFVNKMFSGDKCSKTVS